MSYKLKSLLYLLAFAVSALVYYSIDSPSESEEPVNGLELAADEEKAEADKPEPTAAIF